MDNIRPVSDLRNNFTGISKLVHESSAPVFLTKNGYADMVVLSADAYQQMQYDQYVWFSLREAEREARETTLRYTIDDVMNEIDSILAVAEENV